MPDCDLDQSSTFCSQHPMTEKMLRNFGAFFF